MKLVFVHGAGSSSMAFYYQLRHFRNSKAIDLPGHPTGTPCTSIDGYVEWVRGFNTARRYKDIVLCGHSMGGAIALQYALLYPDELKGLILMGTGARLRVKPAFLKNCREPGVENSDWMMRQKSFYTGVESDIYRVLLRRAEEIGPDVELSDLLSCDKFDVMQEIGNIHLPTEIICGDSDEMTPVKYSDYLAAKIPGAKEDIIPDADHFVQLKRYQQVNAKIEQFLTSLK
ncbi:MAG: alpha/beta hydrolase [Chloroflexi bacterium]|nr:alpha/beta hydrolase [Chloroflexota bacterium]